jgi:hypothetical protein
MLPGANNARTTCEQTVTGSNGLSIGGGVVSTLLCDFVCDVVDLWGEVTQSAHLTTEQREMDGVTIERRTLRIQRTAS